MSNEEKLQIEVESLRAENERLREANTALQAQRREYLDFLNGPPDDSTVLSSQDEATRFVPVERALTGFGRTRAALKIEVARLMELNRLLQAQRHEYLDMLIPGANRRSLDEQEVTEQLRGTIPFSRLLNELGIRRLERP